MAGDQGRLAEKGVVAGVAAVRLPPPACLAALDVILVVTATALSRAPTGTWRTRCGDAPGS
ncbi:hypothetical protein ACFQMH_09855 [Streptomyces viridiviolaceus]|uniref:Uncharacterized protein n=1 Tax=Streptomyces viridiviolaceus TaxID=68282 RepID=A0ABW2DY91_9ACTN|nr:hypothetical protein [Streptomyces viridiviolaceus]